MEFGASTLVTGGIQAVVKHQFSTTRSLRHSDAFSVLHSVFFRSVVETFPSMADKPLETHLMTLLEGMLSSVRVLTG